jgi:thiol-disulfide isomerase/thioredoxin
MKTILLTSLFITTSVFAAFDSWTNKAGVSVQLDLVKTTGEGDTLAGEFRMKNGKTATIKIEDLNEASAEKLKASAEALAKAEAKAAGGKPSVFDDVLDGNLVKLDGKKLKDLKDFVKPTKYYIFYYTASWCPPCQAFTPSLVEFYNESKPNEKFELVLVTSDQDEGAMTEYAVKKNMPWPQLEMSKKDKFEKKFDHGVTGIPSVIVCDLEGNVVAKTRSIDELKKLVK